MLKVGRRSHKSLTLWLAGLALLFTAGLCGCGDSQIVTVGTSGGVQGVWEGTLSLQASGGGPAQVSRLRLELIQREFNFDGYLLKIDPLAEGLGRTAVDTFLVTQGTLSANFVSFQVLDPLGGASLFQGELTGKKLSGTALGAAFNGQWEATFAF